MLELTPDPGPKAEINVGDGVPIRWTLDVDADTSDVVFDVQGGPTFTGDELTKEDLGDGSFRFSVGRLFGSTFVLERLFTQIELRHEADPEALDTAFIEANPRL